MTGAGYLIEHPPERLEPLLATARLFGGCFLSFVVYRLLSGWDGAMGVAFSSRRMLNSQPQYCWL